MTKVERQILFNQFRILALLDADRKSDYEEQQYILRRGFTGLYDCVAPIEEEMPLNECLYVLDVLTMHSELRENYDALEDKAGIDVTDIAFQGFDDNNWGRKRDYAAFLAERSKKSEIERMLNGSHDLTKVTRYPQMLAKWKELQGEYGYCQGLTADEIRYIIS